MFLKCFLYEITRVITFIAVFWVHVSTKNGKILQWIAFHLTIYKQIQKCLFISLNKYLNIQNSFELQKKI